jgi:hypothetical protein
MEGRGLREGGQRGVREGGEGREGEGGRGGERGRGEGSGGVGWREGETVVGYSHGVLKSTTNDECRSAFGCSPMGAVVFARRFRLWAVIFVRGRSLSYVGGRCRTWAVAVVRGRSFSSVDASFRTRAVVFECGRSLSDVLVGGRWRWVPCRGGVDDASLRGDVAALLLISVTATWQNATYVAWALSRLVCCPSLPLGHAVRRPGGSAVTWVSGVNGDGADSQFPSAHATYVAWALSPLVCRPSLPLGHAT